MSSEWLCFFFGLTVGVCEVLVLTAKSWELKKRVAEIEYELTLIWNRFGRSYVPGDDAPQFRTWD